MTRVADEPCILLHVRAYRESSLLISALSLHYGRVSLIGRGARSGKRGRTLQPLNTLRFNWSGRSSLLTLGSFELDTQPLLGGTALIAGLYLAELTSRLVTEREAHPRLFSALFWALNHLQEDVEPVLRTFEKRLLDELGYGLDFRRDARSGEDIDPEQSYLLDPTLGFLQSDRQPGYRGSYLLDIADGEYQRAEVRKAAKQIFRETLAVHLGPRPLLSRKLLFKA